MAPGRRLISAITSPTAAACCGYGPATAEKAIHCWLWSDALQKLHAWLKAAGHFVLYPLIRPLAEFPMTASITLVGRVATTPAAVFYESGAVRVTFSITISRQRFGESSEPFHLELWGKQAQRAYDEIKLGELIGVIGEIRMQEGQPWVLVDRFELLGARSTDVAEVA